MAGKRLSKTAKLTAITGSGRLLVDIAAAAGVHRSTIRAWRDTDLDIAAAIESERKGVTYAAEGNIVKAIRAGDINASKLWLTTIGKSRGYSTRTEVQAEISQHARVTIVMPDNGRDPELTAKLRGEAV